MATKKKPVNLIRTAPEGSENSTPKVRRYGALLAMEAGIAAFAGYGKLEFRIPTEDAAAPGSKTARHFKQGVAKPCIVLDNGDVIWESECALFVQEEEMSPHLEKADQVKKRDIKDHRRIRFSGAKKSMESRRTAHEGAPGPTEAEHRAFLATRKRSEEERTAEHEKMRNTALGDLIKPSGATKKTKQKAKPRAETTG